MMGKTYNIAMLAGWLMLAGIPSFGQRDFVRAAHEDAPVRLPPGDVRVTLPPGFDAYVGKVLETFGVPGLGIAVVKDGKVVLARGYGVRKQGEPAPVDEHTLFLIASNSKAFTSTALAMLVEEGKLKWEDPVIDHLPWFRMSDPYVTMHMTVRDLLVHHSGIQAYAGDLMLFPPSTYSRQELISKLRQIPLVRGFRTEYAYDNVLYLAAGEIVKAVSGMEWEDFVRVRIFDVLGMKESLSRFSQARSAVNIAAAHVRMEGHTIVTDRGLDQAIGDASDPAGGICSNAGDMSKWLITQLDSGRAANGARIFKPSATGELWKIVTPMPIGRVPEWLKPAQMSFWGYALGFRSYNYGAYQMVGHGGKLDGFVSQVAMAPSLRLGIAVLTNQESTGAYWAIINHLLDYYMERPSFDWIGGYQRSQDSAEARERAAVKKRVYTPDGSAKASLPIEKYAGLYKDTLYGEISIGMEEGGNARAGTAGAVRTGEGGAGGRHLVMRFGRTPILVADLEHFQHDSWIARFRVRSLKADAYVNFALNADGSIRQATMELLDPDSDLDLESLLLRPVKND